MAPPALQGFVAAPLRDMPFTLVPSGDPGRAADPDAPRLIAEAFEVMECNWDRSYALDRAPADGGDPGANHFVPRIEQLWLRPEWPATLADGESFPSLPMFYGFRSPGDFWFAEHPEPFAVPAPKIKGLGGQGVYCLANRLDDTVRLTREACDELTGIPRPFISEALLGSIAAARAAGVTRVEPPFLETVRGPAPDRDA